MNAMHKQIQTRLREDNLIQMSLTKKGIKSAHILRKIKIPLAILKHPHCIPKIKKGIGIISSLILQI